WRIWRAAGGVRRDRRHVLAGAFAAALGRLPFSLLERAFVAARRKTVRNAPAPVFILGHWRSGTTHLYNILSRADHFAYVSPYATALPWDFLLLGRALEPLLRRKLPAHRYIDRVAVEATSPQEDEIALANMTPLSFYHALYFPERFHDYFARGIFFDGVDDAGRAAWEEKLRYFYDKLLLAQPGRRLLIKNPVYTARPAMLRRMWPDAKFIHIHRNPVKVFLSMRNFYRSLFDAFALQDADGVDIDEVILSTYERMMERLRAETADLPPGRFIELRFDDLQADPLGVIAQIYRQLDLSGFEDARPAFAAYLDSVRDYRKNRYARADEATHKLVARWRPYFEQWGYDLPV
ncbi:MAG: sulfotransferase, partial [Alphaproteobacteria bacterium]